MISTPPKRHYDVSYMLFPWNDNFWVLGCSHDGCQGCVIAKTERTSFSTHSLIETFIVESLPVRVFHDFHDFVSIWGGDEKVTYIPSLAYLKEQRERTYAKLQVP